MSGRGIITSPRQRRRRWAPGRCCGRCPPTWTGGPARPTPRMTSGRMAVPRPWPRRCSEGNIQGMQPMPQVLVIMLSALCGATMAYLFARLGRRQDKRQEWYEEAEERLKALKIQMDRRSIKLEWKMEPWDGVPAKHAGELLKPP